MSETEQEVKTYVVNYICDECGDGFMEPTGEIYLTNPPQYPHVCNKCGAKKTFNKKYPYQRLEHL